MTVCGRAVGVVSIGDGAFFVRAGAIMLLWRAEGVLARVENGISGYERESGVRKSICVNKDQRRDPAGM